MQTHRDKQAQTRRDKRTGRQTNNKRLRERERTHTNQKEREKERNVRKAERQTDSTRRHEDR